MVSDTAWNQGGSVHSIGGFDSALLSRLLQHRVLEMMVAQRRVRDSNGSDGSGSRLWREYIWECVLDISTRVRIGYCPSRQVHQEVNLLVFEADNAWSVLPEGAEPRTPKSGTALFL